MIITIRLDPTRGNANFGWLDSKSTFAFGSHDDSNHRRFANLRVINEAQDKVQPSKGLDTHSHRDIEVISSVLVGELTYKDSLGNGSVIRPEDVQRMSYEFISTR